MIAVDVLINIAIITFKVIQCELQQQGEEQLYFHLLL